MKRIMFKNFSLSGGRLAGCGVVMLAALGLIFANGTSNWGFLLLVVLCPLMHIFMHRQLHSEADHHEADAAKKSRESDPQEENGHSRIPAQE